MTQLLFKNARIFDGTSEDCPEGMQVRVADGRHLRVIVRAGEVVKYELD